MDGCCKSTGITDTQEIPSLQRSPWGVISGLFALGSREAVLGFAIWGPPHPSSPQPGQPLSGLGGGSEGQYSSAISSAAF